MLLGTGSGARSYRSKSKCRDEVGTSLVDWKTFELDKFNGARGTFLAKRGGSIVSPFPPGCVCSGCSPGNRCHWNNFQQDYSVNSRLESTDRQRRPHDRLGIVWNSGNAASLAGTSLFVCMRLLFPSIFYFPLTECKFVSGHCSLLPIDVDV